MSEPGEGSRAPRVAADTVEALLAVCPGACLVVDAAGRVTRANAEAGVVFGEAAAELAGRELAELLPPGTSWADADGLHLARRRDGTVVAVRACERAIEVEGQGAARVVALDDLGRVRETLEAAEILGGSFRESPLESMTLDHEGRVLEYNRAAERTFGFLRKDVLGKDLADFIVPPKHREAHRKGIARVVSTGVARALGKQLELTGMRADGVEIPVELTIAKVEGREPPVFTGYVRDISERKRFQEQLVTQQKLASLGTLTAGVAHEIKNPLNFINNFASLTAELVTEVGELLEGDLASLDADRKADLEDVLNTIRENVNKICHHGKRADSIVKGMLLHARSGSETIQPTDLNAIAAEYLNLAFHSMRGTDRDFTAKIDTDYDPKLAPIQALPQAISRVVLNLVSNAMYATSERRKKGADPEYLPTIRVETRDLGERVRIAVRDNGVGIEKKNLEKIFEPFFTTKPPGEGTGLGLSLSYDIVVRVHGGELGASSEPGVFTEFVVTLPKKSPAGPKEAA
ncbi:MAG: PAS domain S-box protein [Polyangiaceae bacterium]|nr:PAS domain S-box protein [Polyangiaceae bacterium]